MSNKHVGENALEKMVRLLKAFNAEVIPEGSGEYIDLVMEATGRGTLVLKGREPGPFDLFTFKSLDELVNFLLANQMDRIKMAVEAVQK